jgi:hypothetical protein
MEPGPGPPAALGSLALTSRGGACTRCAGEPAPSVPCFISSPPRRAGEPDRELLCHPQSRMRRCAATRPPRAPSYFPCFCTSRNRAAPFIRGIELAPANAGWISGGRRRSSFADASHSSPRGPVAGRARQGSLPRRSPSRFPMRPPADLQLSPSAGSATRWPTRWSCSSDEAWPSDAGAAMDEGTASHRLRAEEARRQGWWDFGEEQRKVGSGQ